MVIVIVTVWAYVKVPLASQITSLAYLDAAALPRLTHNLNGYSIRKELLLSASPGRPISSNEDFAELWNNEGKLEGWIYYRIQSKTIQRIGYQRVGGVVVNSLGAEVVRSTIDGSGPRLSLIDGKELR